MITFYINLERNPDSTFDTAVQIVSEARVELLTEAGYKIIGE